MSGSGAQVDRYEIEGLVGRGGMADVYRARHLRLGSVHAVKLLRLPTPSVIDRLLREGRAQSSLRHPNVVPVTDVIDVSGAPGLVMEWIDGPDLGRLLATWPLSAAEVNLVAQGVFAGVVAAHAAGWVHRDLKPGNVLLQPLGDHLVPRVTDFGLAKALVGDEAAVGRTRTGALMGTLAYMAPEQLMDAGGVDHRADVWALGVLLHELCTGARPFDASDPRVLLAAHVAPLVVDLRPGLPPEAAEAITWALRPNPDDRAPSVAALASRWSSGRWPADGWSAGTLRCAAELAPVAVPEARVSGSATVSLGADPAVPSLPPPAVPAPTTSRAPSGARVATASAAGAAVVFAAWVAWVVAPRDAAPLTASNVPRIDPDPVAQEQFELAWQSFLQGDRVEASRRLEATRGVAGSPLPELLRSYVLLRDGQVGASLVVSSEAARRWPDDATAGGSLLRVVAAQQRAGSVDVPEQRDHLTRHPDDLLALLMAADHCAMVGAEACERDVSALLAAAPRAPLAAQVAAEAWQELGDRDRARQAVDAGLALSPDDPTLLELRARDALQSADYDRARATLERAQRVDPGAVGPRGLRVRLAVLERDDAALDALRAELTSPSQPLDTRLSFFEVASDTLVGLGRTHAAEDLLGQALALTERGGAPADRFLLHLAARDAAAARGDLAGATVHLDHAAALAAANPEVPRDLRDRLTGHLLRMQAALALQRGDLDHAEVQLRRLRAAAGVGPDTVETVARELAVARRDPATALASGATLWDGECVRGAVLGDAVVRAGDPVRARPLLEAALAGGCATSTRQRSFVVVAHVALAESLLATGEVVAAGEHLDHVDALWPDADPDHAVVLRARAARATGAGRGE